MTTSSIKEAEKIAAALVDKRLAACVTIVPGAKSIYTWKGKREKSKEVLLLAKAKKENFKKIAKEVKALHSYEVPEIISILLNDGNKDYLDWINKGL
jgi:periplasmic divalent cation tolerance protein